jgi:molybdate transport system ATP-binding protein
VSADNRIALQLVRSAFTLEVDISLPPQGITAVFGASGSGKTSLLRCVAGLERPAHGLVRMGGQVWQDAQTFLPTWRRPLGYVFQEASLLQHLTVQGNLHFGLRRSAQRQAGQKHLQQAIELLGIGHLLTRRVQELSGGERQRVAIASALALQPRVLLLDEPLAALDAARRQDILPWLERLRDEVHIPMLYVTHALDEVVRLADHLLVLEQGKLADSGPVAQVLGRSAASLASGEELGVLLHACVQEFDTAWHLMRVGFPGGSLWVKDKALALGAPVRVRVLARDISLAVGPPPVSSIQNLLPVTVLEMRADAHPSQCLVRLSCGKDNDASVLWARITARAADALDLRTGVSAWAQVKAAALVGA